MRRDIHYFAPNLSHLPPLLRSRPAHLWRQHCVSQRRKQDVGKGSRLPRFTIRRKEEKDKKSPGNLTQTQQDMSAHVNTDTGEHGDNADTNIADKKEITKYVYALR